MNCTKLFAASLFHVVRQVAIEAIIVLMRNFNHVILPRLPTSEIILLIFRRDIIIVHYRPRYTAVKRDLSGVRGHRQDKHVSECLKIARQLPHNTHSCPLKFNCEFDSIFARQVSAVPGRLWKSGARARPGKIIRRNVVRSRDPPGVSLIHTV